MKWDFWGDQRRCVHCVWCINWTGSRVCSYIRSVRSEFRGIHDKSKTLFINQSKSFFFCHNHFHHCKTDSVYFFASMLSHPLQDMSKKKIPNANLCLTNASYFIARIFKRIWVKMNTILTLFFAHISDLFALLPSSLSIYLPFYYAVHRPHYNSIENHQHIQFARKTFSISGTKCCSFASGNQNVILDENCDAIEQSVFYSNQIRVVGRKVFSNRAKMEMRLLFVMLQFFWYCFCVVINHAWINQNDMEIYVPSVCECVLHHSVFRIRKCY